MSFIMSGSGTLAITNLQGGKDSWSDTKYYGNTNSSITITNNTQGISASQSGGNSVPYNSGQIYKSIEYSDGDTITISPRTTASAYGSYARATLVLS